MSLTGLLPTSPVPGDYREFIIGAGDGAQLSPDRLVLLIGNKSTAGSETVNTIDMTRPVANDEDAVLRCGRRSELLRMYREYVAVDPAASVFIGPVTESAGVNASVPFVFATTATGTTTIEIAFMGSKTYASVSSGDTPTVIGDAVAAAINQADEGTWMCTASNAIGTVAVTMSLKGPRYGLALGATSTVGMRIRFLTDVTTTVTKGALTAGTVEDDGTSVIAAASLGEFFYIASPWHTTSALTATDNQTGELLEAVKAQCLPVNGKEMTVTTACVGTQAQAVTVATSSPANTVQGKFVWQENSDWLPGMIAAHWCGVQRSQQIAYPSANLNGYRSSDGKVFRLPTAYQMADRPSLTEVTACLNNGVSPVDYTPSGVPYIRRDITSRSLNAQGNNDYKAREGHTFSAIAFAWKTSQARWQSQKQPNVAEDPLEGAKPIPLTSTPGQLKALLISVITDLAGPNPLGIYPGPILDPSPASVAKMKASVLVTKGTGSLLAAVDFLAVEHLTKSETRIAQSNSPY